MIDRPASKRGRKEPPGARAPGPVPGGPLAAVTDLHQAAGNAPPSSVSWPSATPSGRTTTAATYGAAVEPLIRATLQLGERAQHLSEGDALRTTARELNDEVISTCSYFRQHDSEDFFDNRDALGAATSSAVPIPGVYGFREVNEAELRPWAFDHRHELWRSF